MRPIARLSEIEGPGAGLWRAPRKSGLGPLFGGAGIPALAARPQLRAPEQSSGGGHQGAPKKRPGAAIRGGRDTGPRCQTAIEGPGAVLRRGPPRRPEKAAWGRYSGGRDTGPRCQTAIEGPGAGLRRGPPRRPEKAAWGRYSGGRDTGPRCQTAIEGHGAGRWRGPPRRPEKAAWGRYSGGPGYRPQRAARPKLWASSSMPVNATKAPRKSGVWPLFGVRRTRASPAKSGAS